MHTAQLAVEDYAVQHTGLYPQTDPLNSASLAEQIGISIGNPFNSNMPAFVAGIPTKQGEVGYLSTPDGYSIIGFGKNELLLGADGTTFTLSNAN